MRALIVDDSRFVRGFLRGLLEEKAALRAEGFSDLKVMMVTTEAENDFIIRALDSGADEYLMKPFDEEALTERLNMLGLAEN